MTPGLHVHGLRVTLGGAALLHGVDLSVEPGRVLGLVGESGSGKSLAALALLDLLAPATGEIASTSMRVGHHDLRDLHGAERRAVGGRVLAAVFQDPATALDPLVRVGAQVAEPAAYHLRLARVDARAHAARLLDDVGLPSEFVDRFPGELSGGQRQRAALALALAADPQVLIADEATTALDVTTQAQVLALLRRLVRDRHLALVLVSHDLGLVAAMADEVVVLHRGQVVERGTAARVLGAPEHAHTRALVASRLAVDGPGPSRPIPGATILDARDVAADHAPPGGAWSRGAPLRAVDGVSLSLRPGRTLALVGESGSGKSTLARVLLRLHPATSGRVDFQGRDWLAMTGEDLRRARRELSVVFQDPAAALDPRCTVEEALVEPMQAHGIGSGRAERRDRATALLANVALDPALLDRVPGELSGGQRQRVCIARALATSPSCVLLDEPVSALDAALRAQVLELLREIQEARGVSYLFITHDLAAARAVADEVAVMRQGRIVESGPADQVFREPAVAYTAELLSAAGRYSTILPA